jgi:hypothetical protein
VIQCMKSPISDDQISCSLGLPVQKGVPTPSDTMTGAKKPAVHPQVDVQPARMWILSLSYGGKSGISWGCNWLVVNWYKRPVSINHYLS